VWAQYNQNLSGGIFGKRPKQKKIVHCLLSDLPGNLKTTVYFYCQIVTITKVNIAVYASLWSEAM